MWAEPTFNIGVYDGKEMEICIYFLNSSGI